MMNSCRRTLLQLAASAAASVIVLALPFSGHGALAQTGVIKIVVPAPAGGALDIFTRLLAEEIGRKHGRTIVIDNRPGATTVIGTEAVARATPDGSTLLVNAPPAFVINPHLQKVGYDPLTSLEPICNLVRFPTVIVVNSASPYGTLADLLNAARTKPGALTLASIGPASLTRIGFEMLMRAADAHMTFVPYSGPGLALNALLGEHVTSYFGNYTDAAEQVKAGRLRALAVASRERIDVLPDVPTVAESGFRDYEVEGWFGLFAPAKTPNDTLAALAGYFTAAMRAPSVRARLAVLGLYPVEICGADFAALIRRQHDEYGRIIREARISGQ
jgi:tripartite-type tricarboxylate transporter receptor subunit TctC